MIYYKTSMEKLPENCGVCPQIQYPCILPCKRNAMGGATDVIKKAYLTKRHEDCPLCEFQDGKDCEKP